MSNDCPVLQKGQVLVMCAPSGTGKSTLVKKLRAEFPEIGFSISCTTRSPREGEVHGRDYYFLEKDEFTARRDKGEFAEWAEVHGNYYGTPAAPVKDMLLQGTDVLFDIDFQGAMQLRETFPDGLYVFLLPPSYAELEKRLKGRGTDSAEVIEKRLKNARKEMDAASNFDYWVINDNLDRAYTELRTIYLSGKSRRCNRPELLNNILKEWG
ncbi:guanylate kinase [Maridesulfovibrio bastinii]|uniref:guanylate kinase n=1 Tax=Maridesulfovibrio bastinii TaxID=47157 RepID=UPI00040C9D93|nr:guanylate kinase [Maridesulfovibrio bastinii]